MLNTAFDELAGVDEDVDFYPEALREEIDTVNQPIYDNVNNGVYRCGFATTQDALILSTTTTLKPTKNA